MKGIRRHHGYNPVYYNYPYPYYGYPYSWDYYRRPSQPPFVVVKDEDENDSRTYKAKVRIHLPTLLATLLASYILWGRRELS